MWTNENRSLYDRSQLRYPSDLTDEEWALIEPLIPPAKRVGGKRTAVMREVVNGADRLLKEISPRRGQRLQLGGIGHHDRLWCWELSRRGLRANARRRECEPRGATRGNTACSVWQPAASRSLGEVEPRPDVRRRHPESHHDL